MVTWPAPSEPCPWLSLALCDRGGSFGEPHCPRCEQRLPAIIDRLSPGPAAGTAVVGVETSAAGAGNGAGSGNINGSGNRNESNNGGAAEPLPAAHICALAADRSPAVLTAYLAWLDRQPPSEHIDERREWLAVVADGRDDSEAVEAANNDQYLCSDRHNAAFP
jgi:hypothetical protein